MIGHSKIRNLKIEWGQCDATGIVYYPNYFSIFNESTVELFATAGYSLRHLIEEFGIVGYPMIETKANFKIPSSFGDIIEIRSRVTSWRRTSFFVAHEVYRDDQLAIEASEHRVWACKGPDGKIHGTQAPAEVIARMCGDAPLAAP
jgi:4-hydroxybenzoyl-CoA thioesterase